MNRFDEVKQSVNYELEKRRRLIESESAVYVNLKILLQRSPRIFVTVEEESKIEQDERLTIKRFRV